MENLKIRNQKIINAIVEKSNKICPESLALIGITGSFATGDLSKGGGDTAKAFFSR
ncbi:MAG: hypothetical protein OSJ54_00670 [Oscillospiraceae bacterium]|nr:hypothetical protein [Oscillospiraceae bacterium]